MLVPVPKLTPDIGKPAYDARFGGQGEVFDYLLFIGNLGNPFRHADPQVNHTVGHQLESRPPGNDLSGPISIGGIDCMGIRISQLKAGL